MKKILIFPAAEYQISAIKKAKDLGLTVITCDNIPQNKGHKFADYSENVSTIDENGVVEVAKKYNVEAVFTMASDVSIPAAAKVAEILNLPFGIPYNYSKKVTIKSEFRKSQEIYNLNQPKFEISSNFDEFKEAIKSIGFPCVVKPTDCSGSKGIYYLDNDSNVNNVYKKSSEFSRNGLLCIEEFVNGVDLGGEAFVKNGEIVFIQCTQKKLTPKPYFVPVQHIITSNYSKKIENKVKEALQQQINYFQIKNGPLDFDIKIHNNCVYIIEMTPRLGGNCVPKIIEYATKFSLLNATLQFALGMENISFKKGDITPTGVRLITSKKSGILKSFTSLSEIKQKYSNYILEIQFDKKVGDEVNKFTQGAYSLGFVIVQAKQDEEIDYVLESIERDLNIQVENGDRI